MSEVYRNITDATNQSASVLLGVVSIVSDGLVLIAITVVLALVSPAVTVVAVMTFGIMVFGVQLILVAGSIAASGRR